MLFCAFSFIGFCLQIFMICFAFFFLVLVFLLLIAIAHMSFVQHADFNIVHFHLQMYTCDCTHIYEYI